MIKPEAKDTLPMSDALNTFRHRSLRALKKALGALSEKEPPMCASCGSRKAVGLPGEVLCSFCVEALKEGISFMCQMEAVPKDAGRFVMVKTNTEAGKVASALISGDQASIERVACALAHSIGIADYLRIDGMFLCEEAPASSKAISPETGHDTPRRLARALARRLACEYLGRMEGSNLPVGAAKERHGWTFGAFGIEASVPRFPAILAAGSPEYFQGLRMERPAVDRQDFPAQSSRLQSLGRQTEGMVVFMLEDVMRMERKDKV